MTIKQMIEKLQKALEKHGDIEVFFDCPNCGHSNTPNSMPTQAIHLTEVKDDTKDI